MNMHAEDYTASVIAVDTSKESLLGYGEDWNWEGGKSKKTYYSRWIVLAVSMVTAYAAGSCYDYGLYSQQLKENLDLSESSSTLIGSFANAGVYSMIFSGLLLELIGPRNNFLLAGFLSALGYVFLWVIASVKVSANLAEICLTMYLATFGASFFSVTCTSLVVANFPVRDRGKAVGIMKAFLGLGISINSQVYETFFNSLDYLLALAVTLPLVAIIGASVVNYIPSRHLDYSREEAPTGKADFVKWFVLIGVTAIYVAISVFLGDEMNLPKWLMDVLFIPTIGLVIVGIGFYPFQYGPINREEPEASEEEDLLIEKSEPALLKGEDTVADPNEYALIEMLCCPEFWLLFFIFLIAAGICLTVLNNIASMVNAFNPAEGTSLPLMLFGLFETGGRLSVAFSDIFKKNIARVFLLDGILMILFLICFVLAYANIYTLNIAVVVVSYSYGFLYANMAAIIADLFGVRHFGGNLGFSLFAPIIGSFAFSSGIVDIFYKDGCTGSSCFQYVFLTDAGLCLLALLLSVFLKLRIMHRFQISTLAGVFQVVGA